jgi:E3 ubiquitin-protein ligase SHPRH
MDLHVSFTTKADAIVRHILWLRESDAGSKSIIFSQYTDFLNVLQQTFARHRIGFASVSQPEGVTRFKEDHSIECFLLHARAHSNGLNLVNASHVFLCEPILNTAIELQALARVDRIGQQDETTVWLYLVDGTVEESIYNLSVERRMQHMGYHHNHNDDGGKGTESAAGDGTDTADGINLNTSEADLDAANTFELEHATLSKLMSKNRAFGETIPTEDLWKCLFGNRQRREGGADPRLQDSAVMGFLVAEAAEQRRQQER